MAEWIRLTDAIKEFGLSHTTLRNYRETGRIRERREYHLLLMNYDDIKAEYERRREVRETHNPDKRGESI